MTMDTPQPPAVLDIRTSVMRLSRLGQTIGISIEQPFNVRIFLLLIVLVVELLITLVGEIFLSDNPALLFRLGTISSLFPADQRPYITVVISFVRLFTLIFLFNHLFGQDYQWLANANHRYHQLQARFTLDSDKLALTVRRSRIFVWLNIVAYFLAANVVGIFYFILQPHPMIDIVPNLFAINSAACLNAIVPANFLAQYYLVCYVCNKLARQANHNLIFVLQKNNLILSRLNEGIDMFIDTCLIIIECNKFLCRVYTIFLLSVMVVTIPMIYVILNVQLGTLALVSISALMLYSVFQLFYLSSTSGQVDAQTKSSIDLLYREIICEDNLDKREKVTLKLKLIQFFNHVESGSIGITVLGKPVNTSTCITIATAFLSILALLMGNRRQTVCVESL